MIITVNADDFGKNDSVNEAICLAFEKGLINRTTLMTNMPAAEAAMVLASQKGFTDRVGIHVNLTSGKPLTEAIAKDPLMCSADGAFTGDFARSLKTRFFLPQKTRINVERELRAQFEKYKELGGVLWHIDSHHHVHTDPSIWFIQKRVMKDYPVTSVRLGRNMYVGGNPLMHLYKLLLNSSIRRFCKEDAKYFGSAADYESFDPAKKHLQSNAGVEIMVHPVFDKDGQLADAFEGSNRQLKCFI